MCPQTFETNQRPQATVEKKTHRHRKRRVQAAEDFVELIRVEWIRRAACPQHNGQVSTTFVGAIGDGGSLWEFECRGWSEEQAKAHRAALGVVLFDGSPEACLPGQRHLFVALAASPQERPGW